MAKTDRDTTWFHFVEYAIFRNNYSQVNVIFLLLLSKSLDMSQKYLEVDLMKFLFLFHNSFLNENSSAEFFHKDSSK